LLDVWRCPASFEVSLLAVELNDPPQEASSRSVAESLRTSIGGRTSSSRLEAQLALSRRPLLKPRKSALPIFD
jgi:hypothetical protein